MKLNMTGLKEVVQKRDNFPLFEQPLSNVRSRCFVLKPAMSGFLNPQARNVRSHCRFLDGLFQWLRVCSF
jgi:hypothetical protein